MIGQQKDYDEGISILGFAADVISVPKGLLRILWNTGWGVGRYMSPKH
jgi:hypothetical protein